MTDTTEKQLADFQLGGPGRGGWTPFSPQEIGCPLNRGNSTIPRLGRIGTKRYVPWVETRT